MGGLHEDLFLFWVLQRIHQVSIYETPSSSEFVRIRADSSEHSYRDHILLQQLEK